MRTTKLLLALLCALPLAACSLFTPTIAISTYADGRVAFEIMTASTDPVCVDRIAVFEIDDGRRGREVWSVKETPPSDICRNTFMLGETPEGFAQGEASGGPLVVGREYEIAAYAGFVRGGARFTHSIPEAAAE